MDSNSMHRLKPWHETLALPSGDVEISIIEDSFSLIDRGSANSLISGFYAQYREGLFFIAFGEGNFVCFGWSGRAIWSKDVEESWWSNETMGLEFGCRLKSGEKFSFEYQTLKSNPLRLITDLFVPDDEWDLVGDLPCFLQSYLDGKTPSKKEILQGFSQ